MSFFQDPVTCGSERYEAGAGMYDDDEEDGDVSSEAPPQQAPLRLE